MSILRKHWFLILLIFIEIFWWRIVPLFLPSLIDPETPIKNVDYWSIVTNPNWLNLALFGFVIIGILALIRAWRIENLSYRSLIIVAFVLLVSRSICVDLILADESEGRRIYSLTTVEYSGKMYHLAESTNSQSRGVPQFDYLVFECDISRRTCSQILKTGGFGYDKQSVELLVDGGRLVLDWYGRTQILPAINRSS